MRCAICCCVLFSYTVHHQTTSLLCTITNWKKNYALQNLLNIISRAKMHTNTNTFAFVHHKKIILVGPRATAAGRPDVHPDELLLLSSRHHLLSSTTSSGSSCSDQQMPPPPLRKDVPSLCTNFGNLALHSPAIVAAAAALAKSPSKTTHIGGPAVVVHDPPVIMEPVVMRQKTQNPQQQQYLRHQPSQVVASAAGNTVQQPPPPLETNFDRTSNDQAPPSGGNNSRNNRRIGRHESRYTSGKMQQFLIYFSGLPFFNSLSVFCDLHQTKFYSTSELMDLDRSPSPVLLLCLC